MGETMASDYLTCAELVELVTDYFDGALSAGDRARFDEHIMTCPPCQAHLDQMRRTLDVLGRVPQQSLSVEAERDLLDAFRAWRSD
jgi:anti-sigma factor RsiW